MSDMQGFECITVTVPIPVELLEQAVKSDVATGWLSHWAANRAYEGADVALRTRVEEIRSPAEAVAARRRTTQMATQQLGVGGQAPELKLVVKPAKKSRPSVHAKKGSKK